MALDDVKTEVTRLQVEAEAFRQQMAALQKNLEDSKGRFQWWASALLALICTFGGLFLGVVFYAGGTINQVANLEKQVDRIDKRTDGIDKRTDGIDKRTDEIQRGMERNFGEIKTTLKAIQEKQK